MSVNGSPANILQSAGIRLLAYCSDKTGVLRDLKSKSRNGHEDMVWRGFCWKAGRRIIIAGEQNKFSAAV